MRRLPLPSSDRGRRALLLPRPEGRGHRVLPDGGVLRRTARNAEGFHPSAHALDPRGRAGIPSVRDAPFPRDLLEEISDLLRFLDEHGARLLSLNARRRGEYRLSDPRRDHGRFPFDPVTNRDPRRRVLPLRTLLRTGGDPLRMG